MRLVKPALLLDILGGGLICGSGDLAAQCVADDFNGRRLGAMVSYGATVALPYHWWYGFLARNVPRLPLKTALECSVLAVLEIPAITCWNCCLGRNQTPKEALVALRDNYPRALALGLSLWAPSSFLTFKYVAPRWHLLTLYAVGAFWDAGISHVTFDKPF